MSLIALDPSGRFGAATTIELFPFALAREGDGAALYLAGYGESATALRRAMEKEARNLASD